MTRIARTVIGKAKITLMNDGGTIFDGSVFSDAEEGRIAQLLDLAGKEEIDTSFNALHIKLGNSSIMIDAGAGNNFGSSAGFLPEALSEAGIRPEEVTQLIITHLHPDHTGGAIAADGNLYFPNAEIFVCEGERDYWVDEANFSGADKHAFEWRQLALSSLESFGDQVTLIGPGKEIASGVHTMNLAGHTAGHMGVRIESEGSQFVYAADFLHSQDLQLAEPDLCGNVDVDKEKARATRVQLLDMLATDRILFSATHLLHQFIGYARRESMGYSIVPA